MIIWMKYVRLRRQIFRKEEKSQERLEEEDKIDRHEKTQGGMPVIDETLINFHV